MRAIFVRGHSIYLKGSILYVRLHTTERADRMILNVAAYSFNLQLPLTNLDYHDT